MNFLLIFLIVVSMTAFAPSPQPTAPSTEYPEASEPLYSDNSWDPWLEDLSDAIMIAGFINVYNAVHFDTPLNKDNILASTLPGILADTILIDDLPTGNRLQVLLDMIYFDEDGYARVFSD